MENNQINDSYFLNSKTADKWKRIGTKRRAGVAVPLYSIYSSNSVGIGEFPDIKLLVDWCKLAGLSIIQLLPLNDVGDDFAPYNAVSSFAIDPMYISIKEIRHVEITSFAPDIERMKKKFRPLFRKVNYKIKQAKLNLLWNIYKVNKTDDINEFNEFKIKNSYWLNDYTLYKVISELNPGKGWLNWDESLRNRETGVLDSFKKINIELIEFHKWIQWQLYEQLKDVKQYLADNNILFLGDLPFLVSRESADVWSHQNYFMLHLSSGAPPDMYFAMGQKWGMPPYEWNNIANDGFVYVKEKLKYSENFYDMYRIDHFVGLFRVWVSPIDDNTSAGSYMPKEEYMWEHHGRRIIDEMVKATIMLPCAEDLGTVPGCSYQLLNEYGIPGIDFQRYYKNNFGFRCPSEYRLNSVAVCSTHDSSFWVNWWQFETGTIDEKLFDMMCEKAGITHGHILYSKKVLFDKKRSSHGRLYWNDDINSPQLLAEILGVPQDMIQNIIYGYMESYREKEKFLSYLGYQSDINGITTELVKKNLEIVSYSNSIFSIQLLQDYLSMDDELLSKIAKFNCRINTPGMVSRNNWSQLQPVNLEDLLKLSINEKLNLIITEAKRI